MSGLIIMLGIIIVLIVYYLVKYYFFSSKALASYVNLQDNPEDISSNDIVNPESILYTFGSWIYVNNFSNAVLYSYTLGGKRGLDNIRNMKSIEFMLALGGIPMGTDNNAKNIGSPGSPVLTAMISGNTNGPLSNTVITITNNFPIQKWVHVVVSVDTIYADCYLDGKLVISSSLRTQITKAPQSAPSITFKQPSNITSPDIIIAKLTRWDHPLDPQAVWNEYYAGNGVSSSGGLSVGLSVTNDTGTNNYNIYSS
jgi:hypothetical protein